MMRICKQILLLFSLLFSLCACADKYTYVTYNAQYEVTERRGNYVVTCFPSRLSEDSRHHAIMVKKLRMEAIDIIGAYIVFRSERKKNGWRKDEFQERVMQMNLHYNAVVSELRQQELNTKGHLVIRFTCPVDAYDVESITYTINF